MPTWDPLFAMFANFFLDTSNALEEEIGDFTATMSHFKNEEHYMIDYVLMIFTIFVIGMITWLLWKWWQSPTTVIVEKQMKDSATQTMRTGLGEQRLIELRKEKIALTEQNRHLREEWAVAQHAQRDAQRQLQALAREHKSLKENQQATFDQKFKVAGQQASFKRGKSRRLLACLTSLCRSADRQHGL